MFLGHYPRSLDINRRLTLPFEYMESTTEGLYITKGFDSNLLILPASAFQEIYECVMALDITNPLARLLLRLIFGDAAELEVDESAQVTLPVSLADFAKLKRDVILVGQGDYLEVWDSELWAQQESELNNMQANTHRFSSFKIATR